MPSTLQITHKAEIRIGEYEEGGVASLRASSPEQLADALEALAAEAITAANALRSGGAS